MMTTYATYTHTVRHRAPPLHTPTPTHNSHPPTPHNNTPQGAAPNSGELAAIRFTGSYNGVVFDDLFKTKEPLYFRVGGGTLLAVRVTVVYCVWDCGGVCRVAARLSHSSLLCVGLRWCLSSGCAADSPV